MTGEDIRNLRAEKKWSQKEMAEYLGVEQATVSRLERGEWPPSGPILRLLGLLRGDLGSLLPSEAA